MKYNTNYNTAVHWLRNNIICYNNIVEIDPQFEYHSSLYNEENDIYNEVYQFYLTDCTEDDVTFLKKHFNLLFAYSPLLELYVLLVDHYGTSWDYVYWTTDLESAKRELGQS